MVFFRQNIAPFLVVLVFIVALIAVSARIFISADMAAPAPTGEVTAQDVRANISTASAPMARLSPGLSVLINGLPDDLSLSEQM